MKYLICYEAHMKNGRGENIGDFYYDAIGNITKEMLEDVRRDIHSSITKSNPRLKFNKVIFRSVCPMPG